MDEMRKMDAGLLDEARESPPTTTSSEPSEPRRTKGVGVPGPRRENTFETFDLERAPAMREAYERCLAVAEGRAWCAFLWSAVPGNGKTHLAIAALDRWYALNAGGGIFWKVPDFLAFLRETMSESIARFENERLVEEIIKGYAGQRFLLVLDDLGVHKATERADEWLYRILDGRYEAGLPTIITSNAPVDDIDARIWSRYREGKVVCEGSDQR